MFREYVTPYLAQICEAARRDGILTIKHTDGNIMPILDQLVECKPDALHSLDPMAGVDIREVKRLVGDKVCLCGNVNCALIQTGTDEEVTQSAEYCLKIRQGGRQLYLLHQQRALPRHAPRAVPARAGCVEKAPEL